MLLEDGIIPMGAGLHEPVSICFPFVIGRLGTVRQKLIKLFVDVKDATWPGKWVGENIDLVQQSTDQRQGRPVHHSQNLRQLRQDPEL
jgi:hypothetical protein